MTQPGDFLSPRLDTVTDLSDPVAYEVETFMNLLHDLSLFPDDIGEVVQLTPAIIPAYRSTLMVADPDRGDENVLAMGAHHYIAKNRGQRSDDRVSAYIAELADGRKVLFVDPDKLDWVKEDELKDELTQLGIGAIRSDGGYKNETDGSQQGLVGTIRNVEMVLSSARQHGLNYEQTRQALSLIADSFKTGNMMYEYDAFRQVKSTP